MECLSLLYAVACLTAGEVMPDPARFGREVIVYQAPIPTPRPDYVVRKNVVRKKSAESAPEALAYASAAPADGRFASMYRLADGNEQMGCVKNNKVLVAAVGSISRKYGKKVVIDSAYRSPEHNKSVHGATKSYHMKCAALDIAVPGVSKEELFRYVGTIPGIGGRGIYRSGYIHIDTGPRRQWDWRKRRTKR